VTWAAAGGVAGSNTGFDVAPIFVQFTPQHVPGVVFDPVILRWNSSHREGVTPYIELGGGAVRTPSNFPVGDTSRFNFIARGGGVLISTKHAQALEIGCRWWHISNANLGTRNPEFNGIQLSVGWHWYK
jgi:Lipid A 3-O-deacylase (PagL)